VLREFEEYNAKLRREIEPALWPFFAPDPDKFFRWRVQLDCGCIREVLTRGEDRLPTHAQWQDPVNRRASAARVAPRHQPVIATPGLGVP